MVYKEEKIQGVESKEARGRFSPQKKSGRSGAGVGVSSYYSYRCGETIMSPPASDYYHAQKISMKPCGVKKKKSLQRKGISTTLRGIG
jgi:hypothetical protein